MIANGNDSGIANQVQTLQLYFGPIVQSKNNIIVQNQRVENNNAQDIEGTTVVASKSNNEQVNVPVTQIGNYK